MEFLRAGLVVVNVNPLYTPRELKHQLSDSGATCIIILDNFAATLEEIISDTNVNHIILTGVGDMLDFPKISLLILFCDTSKKLCLVILSQAQFPLKSP